MGPSQRAVAGYSAGSWRFPRLLGNKRLHKGVMWILLLFWIFWKFWKFWSGQLICDSLYATHSKIHILIELCSVVNCDSLSESHKYATNQPSRQTR